MGKMLLHFFQLFFRCQNNLGEQQFPCFSHWPLRFIPCKTWVSTTLYKLHQGWSLLCQIYHDLPRFHLGSWPNGRIFEAGDWEKKVRDYSLHGVIKPDLSCPICFGKTSEVLQCAGSKCNTGNPGESLLGTETKNLTFTYSTLALWEMSETQLCPLDGYELRNCKATRADGCCVMGNRIAKTIGSKSSSTPSLSLSDWLLISLTWLNLTILCLTQIQTSVLLQVFLSWQCVIWCWTWKPV